MNIHSISPSMASLYGQCPYKFYCQYCLKLPRSGNMPIAFGCAVHAMAAENYYQKIRTHEDLPLDLLMDFAVEDLEYQDDVDWKAQEQTLDQAKDQCAKTVRAYQEKIAPGIQPKLVEHAWSMEVKNRSWVIAGKTDLITTDDGIYELKTTGKRPSKMEDGSYMPKADHGFQVDTYAMGWMAQTGLESIQGRLDYAIRGKDEIISLPVAFNHDTLARNVVSKFDEVAKWIQREAWPKFTQHYLCSSKYCDYWDFCRG